MSRKQFHTSAHFYLALLIAFSLPTARLIPIFICLMLLNWLIEGDFKNKFQLIVKNKFALLFISFYVLHLLGLFYTSNMDSGLFDLQVKLSLLLFPILLVSRPLDASEIRKVFFALMFGCITAFIIMLSRAVFTYFTKHEAHFFYEEFASFVIHPSYIAMYVNVSLAWLLMNQLDPSKRFSSFFSCSIMIGFAAFIILLSSKMGLLTMLIIYIGFLIFIIISRKKYLVAISGLLVLIVSLIAIFRFVPELAGRLDRAIAAITNTDPNSAQSESTAVRLLIWKASNQVISENLLMGTGTGDAKDELMNEYKKRGMTGALEHKLNAHNEFYQVFVALGLVGFLLLLSNLFFPLRYGFKIADTIYILFLLITILNFLPESMLETQAGVIFYSFFNSLLLFKKENWKHLTIKK